MRAPQPHSVVKNAIDALNVRASAIHALKVRVVRRDLSNIFRTITRQRCNSHSPVHRPSCWTEIERVGTPGIAMIVFAECYAEHGESMPSVIALLDVTTQLIVAVSSHFVHEVNSCNPQQGHSNRRVDLGRFHHSPGGFVKGKRHHPANFRSQTRGSQADNGSRPQVGIPCLVFRII